MTTKRNPRQKRVEEILWTTFSAFGVILTSWSLRECYDDRRVLFKSGRNGPAKVLANSRLRGALLRLYIKVACLLIGLASLLLRPAEMTYRSDRFSRIVAYLLVSVVALLNLETALDLWDRYRIRDDDHGEEA